MIWKSRMEGAMSMNLLVSKKPIVKIWHPWNKWECFQAGFWGPFPEGINKSRGEQMYKEFFLSGKFRKTLMMVLKEWPFSCEHNLTSPSLNKIAWGGQAAAAYALGIPAECRAGFNLLSPEVQQEMNEISKQCILTWYEENGYEPFENL